MFFLINLGRVCLEQQQVEVVMFVVFFLINFFLNYNLTLPYIFRVLVYL